MPGWARQMRILSLIKTNPPQADKLTAQDLIQKWRGFWTEKSYDPDLNGNTGLIATAFWLADDGIAARLRETDDDDIRAVSPEVLKKVLLIKTAESLRTDRAKLTLCGACGLSPTLPLVAGRPSHNCAGCAKPLHTVLACPVANVFADPQHEGIYFCRSCAPPTAVNERLLTASQCRKQPVFPARAVADEHTAIGTRADAQDAIEQRLRARAEAPGLKASMGTLEEDMEEDGPPETEGPQPEDAGPSSNPFRPPPQDTPTDAVPESTIAHVLVSDPSNKIQMDDDFVALQFLETCKDIGLSDFSDICTAVCLGKNQTGPCMAYRSLRRRCAGGDGR